MHREGHVGAALVAYAPLGFVAVVTGFDQVAVGGAVAAVGLAMVPDLDQRVPLVRHRGPTHTVWFALLLGVVVGVAGVVVGVEREGVLAAIGLGVFGFLVGSVTVVSHVAADALTPAGVDPFAPVRDDHYTHDVARAANPVANYALLALGVCLSGVALATARALSGG